VTRSNTISPSTTRIGLGADAILDAERMALDVREFFHVVDGLCKCRISTPTSRR
jgi:hypothetical protein